MPSGPAVSCKEFVSWIEVHYCDDKPDGTVDEINGQSADINKGFGGKYVWLTAQRASSPFMMASAMWVDIRSDALGNRHDDLAKGAGGDYRYVQRSSDSSASHYITDVALWRAGEAQARPPEGWGHMSNDINGGRGKDYLYFVWKTKEYCGPWH